LDKTKNRLLGKILVDKTLRLNIKFAQQGNVLKFLEKIL